MPLDADWSPVPIHLTVEHAPVLELRARVRFDHAPCEREVVAARPFGIVHDAWLRGRPAHERKRAERGFTGEVGVGPDAVGPERMQDIAADMAEGLCASADAESPAVLIRWVLELLAQGMDEARRAGGVGRGKDACRIGATKGPDHGRRVLDVAACDEVLEQRESWIVERDVGRTLRRGLHRHECADHYGGEEDSNRGGHRRITYEEAAVEVSHYLPVARGPRVMHRGKTMREFFTNRGMLGWRSKIASMLKRETWFASRRPSRKATSRNCGSASVLFAPRRSRPHGSRSYCCSRC